MSKGSELGRTQPGPSEAASSQPHLQGSGVSREPKKGTARTEMGAMALGDASQSNPSRKLQGPGVGSTGDPARTRA